MPGPVYVMRSLRLTPAAILPGVLLVTSALGSVLVAGAADFAWLRYFLLVPLLLVVRLGSVKQATQAGLLWGLALYLGVQLSGRGDGSVGAIAVLMFMAAPAMFAGLGAWGCRRLGQHALLLGTGWIGVEWLLAPFGAGLGFFGPVAGDGSAVISLAATLGFVHVAFMVVVINSLVVSLLTLVGRTATRSRRLFTGSNLRRPWQLCFEIPLPDRFLPSVRVRGPPRQHVPRAVAI